MTTNERIVQLGAGYVKGSHAQITFISQYAQIRLGLPISPALAQAIWKRWSANALLLWKPLPIFPEARDNEIEEAIDYYFKPWKNL